MFETHEDLKPNLYADGDNIFLDLKEGWLSLSNYQVLRFEIKQDNQHYGTVEYLGTRKISCTPVQSNEPLTKVNMEIVSKNNDCKTILPEKGVKLKLKKTFKDYNFYEEKLEGEQIVREIEE